MYRVRRNEPLYRWIKSWKNVARRVVASCIGTRRCCDVESTSLTLTQRVSSAVRRVGDQFMRGGVSAWPGIHPRAISHWGTARRQMGVRGRLAG